PLRADGQPGDGRPGLGLIRRLGDRLGGSARAGRLGRAPRRAALPPAPRRAAEAPPPGLEPGQGSAVAAGLVRRDRQPPRPLARAPVPDRPLPPPPRGARAPERPPAGPPGPEIPVVSGTLSPGAARSALDPPSCPAEPSHVAARVFLSRQT